MCARARAPTPPPHRRPRLYAPSLAENRSRLSFDYVREEGWLRANLVGDKPLPFHQKRVWVLDAAPPGLLPRLAPAVESATMAVPPPPKPRGVSLADCLERFSSREQLGEADKWYCSDCKEHVCAFKTMGIWRLPAVLILHLKRFKGGRQAYSWAFSYGSRVAKLETAVTFPREGLDMAPYLLDGAPVDGSTLYDLYAVSCHSGGVGGGHYYANCLHRLTGRWAEYNDAAAGFTDPIEENDASAYLLFYRRRRAAAADTAADALAALRSEDNDQRMDSDE